MNNTQHLLSLTLTALLALTATASAVEPAKEILQDGTILIITTSQLVLKDMAGKKHTYDVTEKTQLSLDGKACRPLDLKSGLKARVMTKTSADVSAISIDAINENRLFEYMQEGKIVSAHDESLVMIADDAKTHSFIITKDTKVTCDGKECKAVDLPANTRIRITKDKTDDHILLIIEAIIKNPDFR